MHGDTNHFHKSDWDWLVWVILIGGAVIYVVWTTVSRQIKSNREAWDSLARDPTGWEWEQKKKMDAVLAKLPPPPFPEADRYP